MGMPTRNTMVVPCMVKSRLNVSGGTTWRPGKASCKRIVDASRPATTRKAIPVTTYMIPSRLWSTVTTQSWRSASSGRRASAPGPATIVWDTTLMAFSSSSAQGQEVRGDLVQVVARELHGRHERARLQRGRVVDPGPEALGRIPDYSGSDRRAAHQVRQVGSEHAVGRGPPHRVTVDARQ